MGGAQRGDLGWDEKKDGETSFTLGGAGELVTFTAREMVVGTR